MTGQEMDFMHTAVSLSMGCKEIEKFNKIVACQFPLASQSINCLPPSLQLAQAAQLSGGEQQQQLHLPAVFKYCCFRLTTGAKVVVKLSWLSMSKCLPQLRSFSFLDMYC